MSAPPSAPISGSTPASASVPTSASASASAPRRAAPSPATRRPLVVLCYACVPAADRGGVQAVFCRVSDALRAAGHRVTTAWAYPPCAARPDDAHWPLATDVRRPLADAAAVGRSFARLTRRLRAERPDIVNVHFPMGQSAYFALLRPLLGYRLVLSLHGSDLLEPVGPVRRVLGALLRRADAVVVVSRPMHRVAVERHRVDPSRVHLVPNGIDVRFWAPDDAPGAVPEIEARAGEPPAGAPRLLAVGRLVDVKGFDLLIDALAALSRARPELDAALEIVGDGPEREALARRIDAAGLADRVTLPGHLGPVALRERLRATTLFVLPSRSEGVPLALLEAMAAGAPVLAADVGGVGDVLRARLPECLVAPDDVDALAAGIAARLDDPQARARSARTGLEVVAGHDERGVADAYAALFESLVEPASSGASTGAVPRTASGATHDAAGAATGDAST